MGTWKSRFLNPILRALLEPPQPSQVTLALFNFIRDTYYQNVKVVINPFIDRPPQGNYCSGLTSFITVEPRVGQCERGLVTSLLVDGINSLERLENREQLALTIICIHVRLTWSERNRNLGHKSEASRAGQGCIKSK